MNKKLFVGGYYDTSIYTGESFEGKTPFDDKIDVYSLEELLESNYVESIDEWYQDEYEEDFFELSDKEKIKAVLEYIETDEISGLLYFKTEAAAIKFKEETLEEFEEIKNERVFIKRSKDKEGFYQDEYISKNNE